jgi:hypothetical protein
MSQYLLAKLQLNFFCLFLLLDVILHDILFLRSFVALVRFAPKIRVLSIQIDNKIIKLAALKNIFVTFIK